MLKLNEQGDLEVLLKVDEFEGDGYFPEKWHRVATAAELRAAGLVQGEVGISREDAIHEGWAEQSEYNDEHGWSVSWDLTVGGKVVASVYPGGYAEGAWMGWLFTNGYIGGQPTLKAAMLAAQRKLADLIDLLAPDTDRLRAALKENEHD